jgi:O-antigen ligase
MNSAVPEDLSIGTPASYRSHALRALDWFFGARKAGVLRFLFFTALAFFALKDPTKRIHHVIMIGGFLLGLVRFRQGWQAWRHPAGFAFAALFIYTLVMLPFSTLPRDSMKEMEKTIDLALFAFAIPMLFPDRRRIEAALFYMASALTAIAGYDLVRLTVTLKGRVFHAAHAYEPFILNHSNISSMVSGAALIVLLYCCWTWRRDRLLAVACAVGAVVNLAYQVVMASRGPQMALAFTALLAGLLILPGWRRKAVWAGLAVAFCAAFVLWGNPRFREAASMKGVSGRDIVWKHTLKLAAAHPILGYGYGDKVFLEVYHHSNPPRSPFHYWHPHQYWLYVLFAQGLVGVALHLAGWIVLMLSLLRRVIRGRTVDARAAPALIIQVVGFILFYGLADWPSGQVNIILLWSIPAGLVLLRDPAPNGAADTVPAVRREGDVPARPAR